MDPHYRGAGLLLPPTIDCILTARRIAALERSIPKVESENERLERVIEALHTQEKTITVAVAKQHGSFEARIKRNKELKEKTVERRRSS